MTFELITKGKGNLNTFLEGWVSELKQLESFKYISFMFGYRFLKVNTCKSVNLC